MHERHGVGEYHGADGVTVSTSVAVSASITALTASRVSRRHRQEDCGKRRDLETCASLGYNPARANFVRGMDPEGEGWEFSQAQLRLGHFSLCEPRDQPAPDPARCIDCPVDPAPAAQ